MGITMRYIRTEIETYTHGSTTHLHQKKRIPKPQSDYVCPEVHQTIAYHPATHAIECFVELRRAELSWCDRDTLVVSITSPAASTAEQRAQASQAVAVSQAEYSPRLGLIRLDQHSTRLPQAATVSHTYLKQQ